MLKFLKFKIGGFFDGYDEICLRIYKRSAKYEIISMNFHRVKDSDLYESIRYPVKTPERLSEWNALGVNTWKDEYYASVCDGIQWELIYREDGKTMRRISGSNCYPSQWYQFIGWLDALMPEMQFIKYTEDEEEY